MPGVRFHRTLKIERGSHEKLSLKLTEPTSTWEQPTERWSHVDATELYDVARWGKGYFSVGPNGQMRVHPERDPARFIDLKDLIDRLQLRGLDLRLDMDDRIALLGANGNGKSTFAKLLAGRLKLDTGTMTIAPQLKVAIFAQHQLDDLRPEENAYEHVRRLMPEAPESKVRARVAQFGLATEKMNTAAKDLSGGEKARLLMGLAAFEGPNLFILDEPTNHLDIDSRESLIEALNDFPGAVILISHDRHLIEATADRLWLVRNGTVHPYDGDLSDYRHEVVGDAADRKERREADKASKADRRREAAQRRAALEPLAKQIKATEALIERIRKRIDTIEDELANPALYEKDPVGATRLAKERSDLSGSLSGHEERWLELSEEYEAGIAE